MSETSFKVHRTLNGGWAACTASVRPCPREQHLELSGSPEVAIAFLNDVLNANLEAPKTAFLPPPNPAIPTVTAEQVREILLTEFGGGHRAHFSSSFGSKVLDLIRSANVGNQHAVFNQLHQALREEYGESLRGWPEKAARLLFLADGRIVTKDENDQILIVDEREAQVFTRPMTDLHQGDVVEMGGNRYEALRLYDHLGTQPTAAYLSSTFTQRNAPTGLHFALDIDPFDTIDILA